MGASPSVAISITGTGFSATASSNDITFTPASGPPVTATATAVTTLSAATGLRRLTVAVPFGLPVGTTALSVLNKSSGETSAGKSLEVIAISLPDVSTAPLGTSNLNVRIAGSPNTAFVAGSTRATFGAGVTVNSTTVESATSLIANISVSPTAALGPRAAAVVTNTQTAQLNGALTLIAAAVNHPPVWTTFSNPTLNVGDTLSVPLAATDPDGDPLTLSVSPLPAFATFADLGNGSGTLSLRPGQAQPGTYVLVATATDGRGASATVQLTVTVTTLGGVPTADGQQLTVAEDNALQLTLTGADPGGAAVTFAIVGSPAHGSLTGQAPNLVYTPGPDYYGPDAFRFVTSNGVNSSDPATVAITVTEVNDPPVLGPDAFKLKVAGTLPGVPPLPNCGMPCGIIYGDPHLLSYDQAFYDAQAVGELISTKSTVDDFEVQARFAAVPHQRVVSIAVAVAMRVAGHRVAFYRTSATTGFDTRIDGSLVTLPAAPQPLPGGGTVGTYGTPDAAAVTWPDGSVVIVRAVGVFPNYYRFLVEVDPVPSRLGHLIGMLGDANGNKLDDLVTRDGQPIQFPDPPFATFYGTYINSWRVSMAETLFDYGPGQDTSTFTDLTFPDAPATPQSLSVPVRTAATNVCGQFGLTNAAVNDACVVDLGFTSDADFATEGAAAQTAGFGTPNNAGSTSVGTPTTVGVSTPGATAVRTFGGNAGQKVTLSVSDNSIHAGADLTITDSSGNVVATQSVTSASAFHDAFTLPSTGTYALTVVPHDQDTGSLMFTVADVPDNGGSTAVGTPTSVTIDALGQVAVRSFAGTAGQKFTLTVISNNIPGADVSVHDPSGGVVTSQFVTGTNAFLDTFTLPVTGTYTVVVDPQGQNTGSLSYVLTPVPDDTGGFVVSSPTTVTIGTVGEVALRTFPGTMDEKVTLVVLSNTILGADVTVLDPSGGIVTTQFVQAGTAFLDAFTLPVTGTYTVKIDPRDQLVGSMTFVVIPVPDDTGTTSFSFPTTVNITTAGEVAVRTFTATKDQGATLYVLANTMHSGVQGVVLTISDPTHPVVSTLKVTDDSAVGDPFTFPDTGTYTVTIDPDGQLTGSLTFALVPTVNSNVGSTAIGVPTSVTLATAGDVAIRSFDGTAGQSLTLSVSDNFIPGDVALTVADPNGMPVTTLPVLAGSSVTSSPFTLGATGTYLIAVVSLTQSTGTLTFTLTPN